MADPENPNTAVQQKGGDVSADLLNNPEVLASLQDISFDTKLAALQKYHNLPKPIKRRVKALKKLQFETLKIESQFYRELNELEIKYSSKYQPFYDRRRDVLTGEVEPTDEDCEWPSDDEDANELANDLKNSIKLESGGQAEGDQATPDENDTSAESGISEFWLTIFRHVQLINDMIEDHDVPILKHLRDVRCIFNTEEKPGFTLEFHFSNNEYFTDTILTKQYFVKFDPMTNDVFSYEGPEIIEGKGCDIHWKHNKNVTVKMIKKVQKHKGRGEKRTVTKTVKTDSFFNFFDPPKGSLDDAEDMDPEAEQLLQADFEIGQFIRERVIPRAVLYYTGEALDDDGYDDEEEEEEGDEEEEDENDDPDDHAPHRGKGGRHAGKGGPQEQPAECKQQ